MSLIPNWIRNETPVALQHLCSSNNDVELFTQYRFKATIGQLPCSAIDRKGEPAKPERRHTHPTHHKDEESAAWNLKSVESNSAMIHAVSMTIPCWIVC
ncbi:hypothetical protein [Pseudomonas sp. NPDC089547]|uniref:hypothetical protein n=1 Tax=Pseudomonas sp. NPDC089547 TaxID=3390652 RepID=UPI003D0057EF